MGSAAFSPHAGGAFVPMCKPASHLPPTHVMQKQCVPTAHTRMMPPYPTSLSVAHTQPHPSSSSSALLDRLGERGGSKQSWRSKKGEQAKGEKQGEEDIWISRRVRGGGGGAASKSVAGFATRGSCLPTLHLSVSLSAILLSSRLCIVHDTGPPSPLPPHTILPPPYPFLFPAIPPLRKSYPSPLSSQPFSLKHYYVYYQLLVPGGGVGKKQRKDREREGGGLRRGKKKRKR